jgi:hypothetical protein
MLDGAPLKNELGAAKQIIARLSAMRANGRPIVQRAFCRPVVDHFDESEKISIEALAQPVLL